MPFTATNAEITRAYRQAMKRAHPDRQLPERRKVAEALARRLNAAYAVLSDPVKRMAYDRTIRQQVIQDQIMRHYVGGFETFDNGRQTPREHQRREPTPAERRERSQADRQASFSLVLVAIAVTAIIIGLVLAGAVFGSAMQALR